MEHDRDRSRDLTALMWPAACAVAAGLAAGALVAIWWAVAEGRAWQAPVAAAAPALAAVVGLAWLSRARTARRRKAAMDAYADREIARWRGRRAAETATRRPGRGAESRHRN
jgi:hypothetical protein